MCNSHRFSCEISPSQYQSDLLAPVRSYCTLLTLENWLELLTRYRQDPGIINITCKQLSAVEEQLSDLWVASHEADHSKILLPSFQVVRSCCMAQPQIFFFPHFSTTYITDEDFLQILTVSLSDSHLRFSLIWGIWSFLVPYSYLNGKLGEAVSHGF